MSDPAKTPEEIEDVLASVRRLVSDHAPTRDSAASLPGAVPAKATPAAAPVPSPEPMRAEALVLTPSFRVTDPEDPWVPVTTSEEVTDEMPSEDLSTPETASVTAQAAEALIAEIVTAEPTAVAEPEGDDTDWQPNDRLASYDAVGSADAVPGSEVTPTEWVDDHSDEASEEDIADLLRLDGSKAVAADFESETGDDNWPEGGAEAALLTLVARREPVQDDAPEDQADPVEALDPVEPDDEPAFDAALAEPEAIEDETPGAGGVTPTTDEEPAQAIADPVDLPNDAAPTDEPRDEVPAAHVEAPSEPEVEAISDVPPIFSDAHGTREDDLDATPVEDLGDTPQPFSFPEADDAILDEDTLREIIVDVVREELQGVLGQRITRNVRKMVRREIRLALAAEDLE